MVARGFVVALVCGIGLALPAAADPLTCAAFKDRLNGALMTAGDPGSEAPDYKEARATDSGGSHVNWDTSALSGSLTCGAGDRFQEFYISLDVTSRDRFVDQLKRLVALDGAAICSFAIGAPTACLETGKVLLQDALQQMGAGFKRRVSNPNGTSDRMLWPDLKAELTAAPSLITFSLAALDGAVIADARRELPAKPATPEPAVPVAPATP